jgi:hypothetical protein
MAIFALIPLSEAATFKLGEVLERQFPGKHFKVGSDHWLLSANSTTQDISGALGITTGKVGQVIVYNIGGYFGYVPQNVWEWLRSNMTTGGVPAPRRTTWRWLRRAWRAIPRPVVL